MHRAEVGHRFRRQSSIRRLKSWLKATRPTMRWRPSPAFSTTPKASSESEKPAVTEQRPVAPPPIPVAPSADRGAWIFQASVPDRWPRSVSNGRCASTMATTMSTRPSARIPAPLVTGPMTREAAIQMVDDRESDARRRFEQLKSEMTGRSAVAIWSARTCNHKRGCHDARRATSALPFSVPNSRGAGLNCSLSPFCLTSFKSLRRRWPAAVSRC